MSGGSNEPPEYALAPALQAMALLGKIVTNPNGKTFTNLKRTSILIHEQFKFKFLDIVHETNSNQG